MVENKTFPKRSFEKIVITGKDPSNPDVLVLTEIEKFNKNETIEGRKRFINYKKRNPERELVFSLINKWNETLRIVHYKGKDFLNVFCDGGIHPSNYVITQKNLEALIVSLKSICNVLKGKRSEVVV